MDFNQALLSMKFSRQEYWNGLSCQAPGDLHNPGIKPKSPTLQVDSLPAEPQGKPKGVYNPDYIFACGGDGGTEAVHQQKEDYV